MMSLRLLSVSLLLAPALALGVGAGSVTPVTVEPAADNANTVRMEFAAFVDDATLSPVTNIGLGDTVTWVNTAPGTPISAPHTATDGAHVAVDGVVGGEFDSDVVASGGSFSHTFTSTGVFEYYCKIHPWMRGVVVVS